jgi:chromate transporter
MGEIRHKLSDGLCRISLRSIRPTAAVDWLTVAPRRRTVQNRYQPTLTDTEMQPADTAPSPNASPGEPDPHVAPNVSLSTIYWLFFQIGALSFGGGLTAWLYREVVEVRKLMTAQEFLSGLTLAQVLPGINMTNLSIYVGQRLRGCAGAITAIFGLISVPFFAILISASIYARLAAIPAMQHFLDGMAAAAVGMMMSMGAKALRATSMATAQQIIVALIIVTVGVLRWPMIPVILVLAPVSIALVWGQDEDTPAGEGATDA